MLDESHFADFARSLFFVQGSFNDTRAYAQLKAKLEADKSIFPRAGALPIMAGNDVIGAIGFGGANGTQGGGTHDEACAKAGLDKIKARVK